jgi:two-component system chemotaxis response regulator CheY
VRTLIVDDDASSAMVLQALLIRYGDCRIAVNGLEGIKAMNEARNSGKPFNLICLDLNMPEMDGQSTLEEIRSIESDLGIDDFNRTKIVMITATTEKAAVIRAIQAQCDGYIVKPFQKLRLLEELHRLKLM